MPEVYITERDGREVLIRTIQDGQHDAETVAVEMATVAQRAYDLGRVAEGTALESAVQQAFRETRLSAKH